ncbi:hypothetical protein Syun_009823 [Stephania yunnanensis]|uniref:Cytochrome P450 n=1 Tax=Stephania yunnanensis TaxID=152371 RepID=A0AAP0KHF2_9MAGN
MEVSYCFIILASLFFCFILKSLLNSIHRSSLTKSPQKLPPGPRRLLILSDLPWLRNNFIDFMKSLRRLRAQHGPIFTLRIGPRTSIFIASHDLAYKALIQEGATFADRPSSPGSNQHTISSAPYGPTWRLLRGNLMTQILHPSRVKSFSQSRKHVLQHLINKLKIESESSGDDHAVRVVDHFRHAMLSSLLSMCFGENLEEEVVGNVEKMMRAALVSSSTRFSVLVFFPARLSETLFPNRWKKLEEAKTSRERVLAPLIRARALKQNNNKSNGNNVVCYVDSLLNLSMTEDAAPGRKLSEREIVGLCSEFLNAGADTTATALQWIMANLVRHQDVQDKVFEEIKRVARVEEEEFVREEDLKKMTYLKAVVLEGLRRHPPVHLPIPHAVTSEVTLEGHLVPRDASVVFMIADMGWDPEVWDRPMEFDPGGSWMGEWKALILVGIRGSRWCRLGRGEGSVPGLVCLCCIWSILWRIW